jgi:hypothetical protein
LPVPPHVLAQYGLTAMGALNRTCSPGNTPTAQAGEHGGCFPVWEHLLAGKGES